MGRAAHIPRAARDALAATRRRFAAADAIAGCFVINGLAFLQDPAAANRSPVGQAVDPWTAVWAVMFLLGGTTVLCRRGWPQLELAGLVVLAAAWLTTWIATVLLIGIDFKGATSLVLATWALVRAATICRL